MVLEVHSCQWSPGAENFWIPAISRMDICVSHQKLSGLWISASLTRNSTNFSFFRSAGQCSAGPGSGWGHTMESITRTPQLPFCMTQLAREDCQDTLRLSGRNYRDSVSNL